MRFGDNLRNLRLQRGYTQQRLAQLLGTSQASITAWETESREPDFATIKRLAQFFAVPLSALLPSDTNVDEDEVRKVSDLLHGKAKLKELVDIIATFGDDELDTLISVARSINKVRN